MTRHPAPTADFSGAMSGVSALREKYAREAHCLSAEDAARLAELLVSPMHRGHKRAHVFYQSVADLLARGAGNGHHAAVNALVDGLKRGNRDQRMACAEGLGCLPLNIRGPEVSPVLPDTPEILSWAAFMRCAGINDFGEFGFEGRSCLMKSAAPEKLVVVKFARTGEDPAGLALEAAWMNELGDREYPARFEVPVPLDINGTGTGLFRLSSLPENAPEGLHPDGWAKAYEVHPAYFIYPNDHRPGRSLSDADFLETMERNSILLGHLAGQGMVHDAVVPLFHNRMQTARREDEGIYEWHKGGRLDRWLESSRYPNIGLSGPRDFEHLSSFIPSGVHPGRSMYRALGAHILSLLLIAGSRFRMDEPAGSSHKSPKSDFRSRFNASLLAETIRGIANGYCRGFSGGPVLPQAADLLPGPDKLADRMIEEMGVDRHMTEHLRAADQLVMSDELFLSILTERGMEPAEAATVKRGEADVTLYTGPHLGSFNRSCSLPEIIEYAALTAGLAVALRFERKQGGKTIFFR